MGKREWKLSNRSARYLSSAYRHPNGAIFHARVVLTDDRRRDEKTALDGEALMMKTDASEERAPTPTNRTGETSVEGQGKAEAKRKRRENVGGDISKYTHFLSATRRVRRAEPAMGG